MFAVRSSDREEEFISKAHSFLSEVRVAPACADAMQARRILFFANMRLGSGHRTLEALGFGIDPSTLT